MACSKLLAYRYCVMGSGLLAQAPLQPAVWVNHWQGVAILRRGCLANGAWRPGAISERSPPKTGKADLPCGDAGGSTRAAGSLGYRPAPAF